MPRDDDEPPLTALERLRDALRHAARRYRSPGRPRARHGARREPPRPKRRRR